MKKSVLTVTLPWLPAATASPEAMEDDFHAVRDPNSNDVLPEDFPKFAITQTGETAPGVLMGSVSPTVKGVGSYFLILDNSGVPLFYSQTRAWRSWSATGCSLQGKRSKDRRRNGPRGGRSTAAHLLLLDTLGIRANIRSPSLEEFRFHRLGCERNGLDQNPLYSGDPRAGRGLFLARAHRQRRRGSMACSRSSKQQRSYNEARSYPRRSAVIC